MPATAAGLSLASAFAPSRCAGAGAQRWQRCGVVVDDASSACPAEVAPAAPRCNARPHEAEEDQQRDERQADRHGQRAQQVERVGLLPQRRLDVETGSTLNGALMTLTESPRSFLKPMVSRTSAVSFSISSVSSGTCVVLPLASVTVRLLTTTAAFRRLTLPVALRVTRTVLSTS